MISGAQRSGRLEWSGEFDAPESGGEWRIAVRVKDAQEKPLGQDARFFKASGTALELSALRPDQAALQAAVESGNSKEEKRLFGANKEEIKALVQALEPLMKPEQEEREKLLPTYNPLLCVFLLIAALSVDVWLRRT